MRSILAFILFQGCAGITILGLEHRPDLYTPLFLDEVAKIKEIYRNGRKEEASARLNAINDEELNTAERAMKNNLVGVVLFSKGEYQKAVDIFNEALNMGRQDRALYAQLRLNLASASYRLGHRVKAYELLGILESRYLSPEELQKFHKLRYTLGKDLGRERSAIISLLSFLGSAKKLGDLKANPLYEVLISEFSSLAANEKWDILEDLADDNTLVVAYLGHMEAEKLYYSGRRGQALDLIKWIKKYFSRHEEIRYLIKNFDFRTKAFTKLDGKAIGLLLPLSGPRSNFGHRAMRGFDAFLRKTGRGSSYQIYTKDSQGSGVVGALGVRKLAEDHNVGVIVGGLFPQEAKKEYIEARKLGIFFISLSQIYLPREEKDHLLFEVPGSVESMVDTLFSDEHLERFGKRAAIIYPETDRGKTFVNAFWENTKVKGATITGLHSYKTKTKDFRAPVKKLLGLTYTRERQEEHDILKEVYAFEKHAMRRVQILGPQIDFDWVFVPAFPLEAMQIIPSFSYFDAADVKVIGGPSWRSKGLSRESRKFKNIYFLGDTITDRAKEFGLWFRREYGRRGGIIEMMAFDAFYMTDLLLGEKNFKTRTELDVNIRDIKEVSGLTGGWRQKNGLWIKLMSSLHLKNGKVVKN